MRFKGDQSKAGAVYDGTVSLKAEDIAEGVLWAATLPPHVNINRMEIMATTHIRRAGHRTDGKIMDKNTRTISMVFLIVAAMVGLAFASVPLYRMFRRSTGFGVTMLSDKLPDTVLERTVTVKFDTNTSPNMDWSFKPETSGGR